MLTRKKVNSDSSWYFMEVPRTGTSTIERTLRQLFPDAKAPYQKHWPVLPQAKDEVENSVISVRNPYSRAVSCWQYFTVPDRYTFQGWLEERLREGFCDVFIEAQPQALWYNLQPEWDFVIRQERLKADFHNFLRAVTVNPSIQPLQRYNDINGPWVNKVRAATHRNRPWKDYYCSKTESLVQELYQEDFTALSKFYSPVLEYATTET